MLRKLGFFGHAFALEVVDASIDAAMTGNKACLHVDATLKIDRFPA
jgi:hypothetical protein